METFLDKNGNEITEGCLVILTTNEIIGEERRKNNTYNVYGDIEAIYCVRYGLFKTSWYGDIITWYLETDKSITYSTGFYRGMGYTKAEKLANESITHTRNLNRPLSTQLAYKCELIKIKETV